MSVSAMERDVAVVRTRRTWGSKEREDARRKVHLPCEYTVRHGGRDGARVERIKELWGETLRSEQAALKRAGAEKMRAEAAERRAEAAERRANEEAWRAAAARAAAAAAVARLGAVVIED